jgi:hypothetical protein
MRVDRVLRNTLAAVLAASVAACGFTAPRSSDGFADLESLGMADTDVVMTLSLGPAVLRFASSHIEDDPETKALLKGLDGVRIRIYEIDGDASRVAGRISTMSENLVADGWSPVMQIREAGEQTHMLVRMRDEGIVGLTVLVTDGASEAVIVNIMGDIRPEQFSDVMVALDVDAPGVEEIEVPPAEAPASS